MQLDSLVILYLEIFTPAFNFGSRKKYYSDIATSIFLNELYKDHHPEMLIEKWEHLENKK